MMMVVNGDDGGGGDDINCGSDDGVHVGGNDCNLILLVCSSGASEPRNMAYMSRLGIWGKGTPFKEFGDFIQAVERR